MSEAFSQCQCFVADCQTAIGIAKQPMDNRTDAAGAHAGVMPAVMLVVKAMSFRVIKPAPCITVLAGCRRFAGEHCGRPGRVTGLQAQPFVRLTRGQLQQRVRQSSALADRPSPVGRLPKSKERHELLARVSPLFGEFAGAGIGFCRLDRSKPFARE